MAIIGSKEELVGESRLTAIARADPKRWYQKPNLRFLYLILVPCALGVEWTSGFDSSMMNSLQAVTSVSSAQCLFFFFMCYVFLVAVRAPLGPYCSECAILTYIMLT